MLLLCCHRYHVLSEFSPAPVISNVTLLLVGASSGPLAGFGCRDEDLILRVPEPVSQRDDVAVDLLFTVENLIMGETAGTHKDHEPAAQSIHRTLISRGA